MAPYSEVIYTHIYYTLSVGSGVSPFPPSMVTCICCTCIWELADVNKLSLEHHNCLWDYLGPKIDRNRSHQYGLSSGSSLMKIKSPRCDCGEPVSAIGELESADGVALFDKSRGPSTFMKFEATGGGSI